MFFQESLGVGNAFREDGLVDIHAGVFVIAIETLGEKVFFYCCDGCFQGWRLAAERGYVVAVSFGFGNGFPVKKPKIKVPEFIHE